MNALDVVAQYDQGQRDFRGINLHEQSLMGAQLSQSLWQSANFTVANLSSANLSDCNLSEANFNVARLNSANLSGSQLFRASLNVANLIRAVLTGANLTESSLVRTEAMRCEMSNTILRRANLSESDLRESQIRWSDLSNANLTQVDLRKSSLVGSHFYQANLQAANLSQCDLRGAILQEADLKHAKLRHTNLSGANLRGANLRWADLRGANLSHADLTGAKLSGANLTKADLSGADLSDTSFIHADLSYTNLMHAQWSRANLTEATLTGTRLYGSCRFHLVTQDLICDWVDLSAKGNGTQLQTFENPQAIDLFFNRAQPAVQVLIDAPLSLKAHAAVARLYAKLVRHIPEAERPPCITVDQRKTQFTFAVSEDILLFSMVYFATLPFLAGRMLQRHLMMLTSMLQTHDTSRLSEVNRRHLNTLSQALVDLCHRFPNQPYIAHERLGTAAPFFAKPLQVQLTNSQSQQLTLYHSPAFGVRAPAHPEYEWPLPNETDLSPGPSLETLVSFLLGMQTPLAKIRPATATGHC